MKSIYSVLALSIVFGCISCQKTQNQEIYFHKSHEESRKNAPFSDVTQVGNLYFLTGQIGKNHQTGKMADQRAITFFKIPRQVLCHREPHS